MGSIPTFGTTSMQLSDFDYDLPPELIAQQPAAQRSASRLLHLDAAGAHDRMIRDLPQRLRPGDLLVFNDTRVIPARVHGRKESGGKVQLLLERITGEQEFVAQVGASKTPKPGTLIQVGETTLETLGRDDDLFRLRVCGAMGAQEFFERHGELPLPPYITHKPDAADAERYQTVFAAQTGAVAAPTAGLHFDQPLLDALRDRGVETAQLTLHVGAGTFQPVRVDDLAQHRMHAERFLISEALCAALAACRQRGGRVVAVGTTVTRALESAVAEDGTVRAGAGETRIFITPGFRFRAIDLLLTNFHLPRSTLLMLVSAFGGHARMLDAYRHAVQQRYRFFSYGDAMLIEPEAARGG
ncbi:MAG TPA: tRNA preQ1(34) S-adenosylmethionine ribosyltransferase-isomerase QueA [Nevskiaceae bacterium]|nr:tRNA preQ1(34) S-adenosylmethionine ribosyltransferase-isomerase QueA [Nevskiaceae bacterium]